MTYEVMLSPESYSLPSSPEAAQRQDYSDDYRGLHRSPGPDNSPLHNLQDTYPEDIYGPHGHRYYGHGDDALDRATIDVIRKARNQPEMMVDIFRAVPKTVRGKAKTINHGDWVTINRNYAVLHGDGPLGGNYHILTKKVPAKHLFTNGDSIHEWGYHPSEDYAAADDLITYGTNPPRPAQGVDAIAASVAQRNPSWSRDDHNHVAHLVNHARTIGDIRPGQAGPPMEHESFLMGLHGNRALGDHHLREIAHQLGVSPKKYATSGPTARKAAVMAIAEHMRESANKAFQRSASPDWAYGGHSRDGMSSWVHKPTGKTVPFSGWAHPDAAPTKNGWIRSGVMPGSANESWTHLERGETQTLPAGQTPMRKLQAHGWDAETHDSVDDETAKHLLRMAGTGSGGKARIHSSDGVTNVQAEGPHGQVDFSLHDNPYKGRSINWNWAGSNQIGHGFGVDHLADVIDSAKALGAREITAQASDVGGMIGYRVWPKMGFDAPIPQTVAAKLPEQFKDAKTVQDLYKTREGRRWWEDNGETFDAKLDLTGDLHPVIKRAMARRGGQQNYAQDDADHPHIHTPEFKNWFGDWTKGEGSKVVRHDRKTPYAMHGVSHGDSNVPMAAPITVYHGTPHPGFEAFSDAKIGSNGNEAGLGYYFAENPKVAETYASLGPRGKVIKAFLNVRNPYQFDSPMTKDDIQGIHRALLDYKSRPGVPDHIKSLTIGQQEMNVGDMKSAVWRTLQGKVGRRVNDILAAGGWDGIEHRAADNEGSVRYDDAKPDHGRVYIAFHPHQIKSAIGNRGTYDPKDARIHYAQDYPPAPNKKHQIGGWTIDAAPSVHEPYVPHIAKLLGPDGGTAKVHRTLDGSRHQVQFKANNGTHGDFQLTPDGIYWRLAAAGSGRAFGADHIVDVIDAARAMGAKRIQAFAAGGDGYIGYKVWPKMGFDGDLPNYLASQLPDHLKGSKTVQDLYKTRAGRDWWEKNGSEGLQMTLDLSKDHPIIAKARARKQAMGKQNYSNEGDMVQWNQDGSHPEWDQLWDDHYAEQEAAAQTPEGHPEWDQLWDEHYAEQEEAAKAAQRGRLAVLFRRGEPETYSAPSQQSFPALPSHADAATRAHSRFRSFDELAGHIRSGAHIPTLSTPEQQPLRALLHEQGYPYFDGSRVQVPGTMRHEVRSAYPRAENVRRAVMSPAPEPAAIAGRSFPPLPANADDLVRANTGFGSFGELFDAARRGGDLPIVGHQALGEILRQQGMPFYAPAGGADRRLRGRVQLRGRMQIPDAVHPEIEASRPWIAHVRDVYRDIDLERAARRESPATPPELPPAPTGPLVINGYKVSGHSIPDVKADVGDKLHHLVGLAGQGGDPDDSHVQIFSPRDGVLGVNFKNPRAIGGYTYYPKSKSISWHLVRNSDRSAGHAFSASQLADVIENAKSLGVEKIKTTAARADGEDGYIGYRVWPKMGFDGEIPAHVLERLPENLRQHRNVQDLYKTREGRKAWEEHGDTTAMTLDLTKPLHPVVERALARKVNYAFDDIPEFDVDHANEILGDSDHFHHGLRVMTNHGNGTDVPKVGDVLPNSYRWDDGESTGEELDGTSSIHVYKRSITPDVLARIRAYAANGKHLVLVGGSDARAGEDQGEAVIPQAKVLAVYRVPQTWMPRFGKVGYATDGDSDSQWDQLWEEYYAEAAS